MSDSKPATEDGAHFYKDPIWTMLSRFKIVPCLANLLGANTLYRRSTQADPKAECDNHSNVPDSRRVTFSHEAKGGQLEVALTVEQKEVLRKAGMWLEPFAKIALNSIQSLSADKQR